MSANNKLPADCQLLYDNASILAAIDTLAVKLTKKIAGKNPLLLTVMQGGLIFAGHLIPRLQCMLEIDYVHATRYNNETTGGELVWKAYPTSSLKNRTILILDDILDEGHTLKHIIQYCESQGATEVFSAVLVKKIHTRCIEQTFLQQTLTDNIALTVEDEYVFGFGMDYNGQYRQLDAIYKL